MEYKVDEEGKKVGICAAQNHKCFSFKFKIYVPSLALGVK